MSDLVESPPGQPQPEPRRHRGGMSSRQWVVLAIIAPAVLVAAFVIGRSMQSGDDAPGLRLGEAGEVGSYDWDYLIPAGTAERLNRGEEVEIVPAELEVTVGDTIRIVNDDDVDHIVGVFYVRAGATLTQQFQSAGVLQGECDVHPSGEFTLTVLDA